MARSQKHSDDGAGSAGRLAAGRRPRGREGEAAPGRGARSAKKAAPTGKGKGNKGKASSSSLARVFKLVTLLSFMAVLGFAVVLVVDVGITLIGNVRFGESTFGDLVAKVTDRVLDRDVPQPRPARKAPTKTKTKPSSSSPSPPSSSLPPEARAPLPAPRPEDYARHVAEPVDPNVQAAKARLDKLLNRL